MQERHFACKLVSRPWPLRWFSAPLLRQHRCFCRYSGRRGRGGCGMAGRWWLRDGGRWGHWLWDDRWRGVGFWGRGLEDWGIWGLRDDRWPDYIGRCNITKIASSFPLCDGVLSRRAGQIGKFACQIVEWGRPLPAKISGCAPTLFRIPVETFRVLLFSWNGPYIFF